MEIPLLIIISLASGILAILLALVFAKNVMKQDAGNEKMQEVSGYIESGAKTFISVQYKILIIFVAILSLVLLFAIKPGEYSWAHMIAYLIGSAGSMWAGWLGMIVGVKANTRAAQACTKGIKPGFVVSFFGGCVMGLAVVGVALIGVSTIYWIAGATDIVEDPATVVLGFSFGASSVALFAKCGGGIYTKTADVGADLVGKAEYNLPEDDPRNPASIADNVGDNVGDIAGMGSDLFDSYVASIVAAMLLTGGLSSLVSNTIFAILPILICSFGLFASIIGIYIIKVWKTDVLSKLLNGGTYLATVLFIGLAAVCIGIVTLFLANSEEIMFAWALWLCATLGILSGVIIGWTSDYFTREDKTPTRNIANAAQEGHAVTILSGFSYGLLSVFPPAIGIVAAMAGSYLIAEMAIDGSGIFGIAIAAVGMLSIVATIVSNDAYGPICDNARGIAEQGDLGEDVIRTADRLDSAGNTAKAITKGFAIGAANLTVLALLFSYRQEAEDAGALFATINLLDPGVLIGAFLGVVTPAIFSALLVLAVQRNAGKMVLEIRRQFEENPKILSGEEAADFNKCIDIATKGSIKELLLPSMLSIGFPIIIGILFGVASLGAFLAGAILSGFVFAIFMSNSGGAWDNAKKFIEDGNLGGKGTETHKAAITGDTVGDPFKDTSGPSINTLLVVMSLTATLLIGLFILIGNGAGLINFLI
ncbi:MAG: sodium-translocating pyrophosphatase [Candidatus Lokiarchaeota archaeon]|nr:sodium-translocating pyrophosphatase [Candidatus Lokiarchaeota archaeon]